jgi:hypothetical protein
MQIKEYFKSIIFSLWYKAWTGGAFSPLGPFLCPTNEEKNDLLPQGQGRMTCIE